MITPAAIQKKDFTRGVRGYKEEEVDAFLDTITLDLESLLRENNNLKESNKLLTQEIERYRGSETAIFNTLESAKALMTDISASAEKRAEIVLKNAELDADRIRREAQESVERLTEEALALSRRWELFSARFKNLLETELDRFDSFAANLLLEEQAEQRLHGGSTLSPRKQSVSAASPSQGGDPGKTIKTQKRI
ncbi:MAG: DivIVA domain-containing protein [Clostridiales Family XIII bacterium]|jgi:cell division initiation protein|nr:DivIVA domain-containing protein [Clostridiales Family XIII bacterium]